MKGSFRLVLAIARCEALGANRKIRVVKACLLPDGKAEKDASWVDYLHAVVEVRAQNLNKPMI